MTVFVLVMNTGAQAQNEPLANGGGSAATAPAEWRQVAAGAAHTCGIRSTGRLLCWGKNSEGQLGDGTRTDHRNRPTVVRGATWTWSMVSTSYGHSCAISSERRLYCWGKDTLGALGDGGWDRDRARPVEVVGHRAGWATVSAGGNTTCGVKANGRLFCWGDNRSGSLGTAATVRSSPVPVEVAGASRGWVSVSVGLDHVCANQRTGRLYCWGSDRYGQLGDDALVRDRSSPVEVAGSATNWEHFDAGYGHTCGQRSDGGLYCWGRDYFGELGDGDTDNRDQPLPVLISGEANDWTSVSAGGNDTCAGRADGRMYCWGSIVEGETGPTGVGTVPIEVPGGYQDWTAVSSGSGHRCGVRGDSRLFCWGEDSNGEVGNGPPRRTEPLPVRIP